MDVSTTVGLRNRAIIAVMTYTFARVEAVVALSIEDYFPQKKRWWLRHHEKKARSMKCRAITRSWSEAARISSSVTGGSKLNRVLIFLHMVILKLFRKTCGYIPIFACPIHSGKMGIQKTENAVRFCRAPAQCFEDEKL